MPDRHFHTLAFGEAPRFRHPFGLTTVALLAVGLAAVFGADDTIPKGFGPDRYAQLWQRNPFTLVTPVTAEAHATAFDKMVLVSWSQDGNHEVVFVQNTDTNDVQKVGDTPNAQGLRLIEVHRNASLQGVEAILANGTEQGPVRFRTEVPTAPGTAVAGAPVPGDQAGAAMPGTAVPPMPAPQPPVPNANAFNAAPANQRMNSGVPRPNNLPSVPRVPGAADYRRRRVLPTPNITLQPPVNPQAPASPNRENQD
ncbi:MAG TPA: hypothetical protein VGD78_02725 [Chthoniobacterales bacterium]